MSCRGLQDVAVCCSCHVHGRSVCCSVLQCVAVCRNVSELQLVAECCVLHLACSSTLYVLQCVAVCCSVLQCVAVCCSVLQCVAVCCSVSQCEQVAVSCDVSQCVAAGMFTDAPCAAVRCSVSAC